MFGPEFIAMHSKREPYDVEFNTMTMSMARMIAGNWQIVPEAAAPTSLPQLNELLRSGKALEVSGDHCEHTIFACPEHNVAFRAWHDATHWLHQFEFTVAGEAHVGAAQCMQMFLRYGVDEYTTRWAAIILAEVIGQAVFNAGSGLFPYDQYEFTAAAIAEYVYLAERIAALYDSDNHARTSAEVFRLIDKIYGK